MRHINPESNPRAVFVEITAFARARAHFSLAFYISRETTGKEKKKRVGIVWGRRAEAGGYITIHAHIYVAADRHTHTYDATAEVRYRGGRSSEP